MSVTGSGEISTLPDSIWISIFEICITPPFTYNGDPWNRIIFDSCSPGSGCHPIRMRNTLSSINQHWRKIVLSTPSLWTMLVLDSGLKRNMEYNSQCLKLSTDLPLDLIIRPNPLPRNLYKDVDTFQLLRDCKDRILTFQANYIHFEELRILFPLPTEDDPVTVLPMLREFCIQTFTAEAITFEGYRPLPQLPMGRIYAPNIVLLQLGDAWLLPSFLTSSYIPIRWLILESHEPLNLPSTCIQFLICCPRLESLTIRNYAEIPGDDEWPGVRYPIPSLRNLSLLTISSHEMLSLFRSLLLPSLEIFRFGQLGYNADHLFRQQIVWHFMTEAAFTLGDLLLDWFSFPHPTRGVIEPLLSRMVNLQILELHELELKPSLLEVLVPERSVPPHLWPCPQLRSLIFRELDIGGDEFLRLVEVRCFREPPNVEYETITPPHAEHRFWVYPRAPAHYEWFSRHPSKLRLSPKDWKAGRRCTIAVFACAVLEDTILGEILKFDSKYGGFLYSPRTRSRYSDTTSTTPPSPII